MIEVDIQDLTMEELDSFEEERVWRAILTSAKLRKTLIFSELSGGFFVFEEGRKEINQEEYKLRIGELRQIDWLLEIINLIKGQIKLKRGD